MTKAQTEFETVLFEVDGAVARITLDRPKQYNAFNKRLRADFTECVNLVENDDNIRICIVCGGGPGFSAGGDLTDFGYDPISKLIMGEFKPFLAAIAEGNKIYIAQIHGTAAGISAALAMSCDFIVMAENASIYMAFAAIALVPDGGNTWHLMNAMGYRRALEAIVEGRHITAAECLNYGIANKVVASSALSGETEAWAQELSLRAPLALAATKRLLRSMTGRKFVEAIEAEANEQNALVKSNDFKRGAQAFLSKQAAVFEGN